MKVKEESGLSIARAGAAAGFDPEIIKADFPILSREVHGKRLVYLDNAATTQKPESVIQALDDYYRNHNANVHRGIHTLAEEATAAMEGARQKVADFIGGVKTQEVIFTRNCTEAINLVAYSWGRNNLGRGDRIVLTEMEHHANLVPWIALAKRTGAELRYIPIDNDGYLNLSDLNGIISPATRILALTHMSNVLGTINPVEEIIELAHRRGALTLVDAAQSIPHMPVNVKDLDADFVAFSAHKMLGPTGIGILYGKENILNEMEPFIYGGDMIREVRFDSATWNELPWKFEGGTPNIGGAAAFAPALDYLAGLGMDAVRRHEIELISYALDRLQNLGSLRIFGPSNPDDRGGTISFIDNEIHPHDLATILDTYGVAIRAGHHCAQPLMKRLGVSATVRASFYIYNTKDDIDRLVEALKAARRFFGNA
ncbi:MAG: cysteine desulfurase [candidate division Zixibacteria bacterium RBG_16_53_22]|nr:MAG: cysteine desulfurase [candidate division Zixibacteria bacterium RBG_16_53_22]